MSVKNGLLALLTEGAKYGYQLRSEFEQRAGATWALNVGQVYTTLGRLERDGLVTSTEADAEGRHRYELTAAGREEVQRWFDTAVPRDAAPRDELTIKLALALSLPGVDAEALLQQQRTETMRTLQHYTRLKAHTDEHEVGWLLTLDALVFQAEAELRWLDHCQQRLVRLGAAASALPPAVADPTSASRPDDGRPGTDTRPPTDLRPSARSPR